MSHYQAMPQPQGYGPPPASQGYNNHYGHPAPQQQAALLQYPPGAAPHAYAQMGMPVTPSPHIMVPPGILVVIVQPRAECERRQESLDIKVNGVVVGNVFQGGRSEHQVHAGAQNVSFERGGMAGAVANFFGGTAGSTSVVVQFRPGQRSTLSVRWERDNCCSNRYYPRIYAQ
jgi:hypothetical protein